MEWLADPTIWAGLATLVVLEVVLGIDNLIFIAILSDKLPPEQRQKARVMGLSLALIMRLVLLASISWLTSLTYEIFGIFGFSFSWRDIIMIVGGGFLLFKATLELHEKLEPGYHKNTGPINYASFWQVIIQIVILDAVFSLDAVITAVGMTSHIGVAMVAVCVAILLMIIASNALMNFVSARPTVVILCLGFLMMIGFSLIVEGLGYHIPKGYLYAAIGFSVLVEAFNQTAQHNRKKVYEKIDPRTRISQAVLSIMGSKNTGTQIKTDVGAFITNENDLNVFNTQERMMIGRVLHLSGQTVQSIMTPRHDLYWIDFSDDDATLFREIRECPYSCMIVARDGNIDEPIGIIHKKEVANLFIQGRTSREDLKKILRQPLFIPETVTVLEATDMFRRSRTHVGFILDEYGTLEGLVTLTDVAEAIAGDLPEQHEEDAFMFQKLAKGMYLVNGSLTIQELQEIVGTLDLPSGYYNTAAGIALSVLQKVPEKNDTFKLPGWEVSVEEMEGRRVSRLRFVRESVKPAENKPA